MSGIAGGRELNEDGRWLVAQLVEEPAKSMPSRRPKRQIVLGLVERLVDIQDAVEQQGGGGESKPVRIACRTLLSPTYADKDDHIMVDNQHNITGLVDWEFVSAEPRSWPFSSPYMMWSVAAIGERSGEPAGTAWIMFMAISIASESSRP